MSISAFVSAVTTAMKPVASLHLWKATTVLALMVNLVPLSLATEYDEYNPIYKPDVFGGGRAYDKPPQCVPIPDDLRLCHGVGYNQMLMPNLLEHESMAEVRQQAGSWVPLVHKACHPGTRIFLCSLFAPVCMDQPINPCRWLCESVRQGCAPVMEAYGFPWPEMLACDKFPQDDVCISAPDNQTSTNSGYSPVCPPCDNEMKTDAILEHMCASEFAIKTKIKEVKRENADRKVILQKKRKLVKTGSLKKKDLKTLTMYLKNGADCPCSQLDNPSSAYLIMGRKTDRQYLITGIHKWDKSNKEFKKTLKKMQTHKCPTYEKVFK